jgi:hypothetical protein
MPRHQATPIGEHPGACGRRAGRFQRGAASATTSVTIKAIRRSSGRPLLLHSLHAAAVRTVKYVEVRQPLKVLDVPNKLHRGTTMRACRSNGLVCVGHG